MADKRHLSGVTEGAQHSCDIFQRGSLCTSFREWQRRVAFKIDADVVILGPEDLCEMIVPVNPSLERPNSRPLESMKPRQEVISPVDQFVRIKREVSGLVVYYLLQSAESCVHVPLAAIRQLFHVFGLKRFRRKSRIPI